MKPAPQLERDWNEQCTWENSGTKIDAFTSRPLCSMCVKNVNNAAAATMNTAHSAQSDKPERLQQQYVYQTTFKIIS